MFAIAKKLFGRILWIVLLVVAASADRIPDFNGSPPLTDIHNHDGFRDSNGFGNEWVVHLVTNNYIY
jgi:hypothetical protein